MGRVFTYDGVECIDEKMRLSNPKFIARLTEYYNEFVLQLKLAEHNLNVGIISEVKETYKNDSLEKQRGIFKSLNEAVLPALELIVSYYS